MANIAPNFGQTWSCVSDITMPAIMVSGNRVVAEDIARRLQTALGQLIDDPTYGFDLTEELNDDIDTASIARIAGMVNAECLKVEAVAAASSTVVMSGTVMVVTILVTTASGPFTMVLSVSGVTVSLLQVTP